MQDYTVFFDRAPADATPCAYQRGGSEVGRRNWAEFLLEGGATIRLYTVLLPEAFFDVVAIRKGTAKPYDPRHIVALRLPPPAIPVLR